MGMATTAGTPPAANPMAGMMQQMMNNPFMMQNSMAMMNQMYGGAAMPTPPAGASPGTTMPAANPMMETAQRARFAGQLSQLVAMGFTNEAVCLRVLTQHNGRIDA